MKKQQTAEIKAKKEKLLDRIIGVALFIAGITGVIVGIQSSHISILWPILGLAGMSIFIDTFLKRKAVKIVLNIIFTVALVITFFIVRDFNHCDKPSNCIQQQTTSVQIDE